MIEQMRERQSVITNYEERFLQVRSIIERQDAELRAAHTTLETVRDQLATEEDRGRSLQAQIEDIQRESKTALNEINARVEMSSAENTDRYAKQIQDFERKLQEKDKFMEGLQMRHQQELSHMTDMKDQEIQALQEQI